MTSLPSVTITVAGDVTLFEAYARLPDGGLLFPGTQNEGKNHPGGVMIHYYLKDTTKHGLD